MREDIGKVINEYGKTSPRVKTAKTRAKISPKALELDPRIDEMETRASTGRKRKYGWDAKAHISNYRPLDGWLMKNLNRPWDKIYSELCERFDKRSRTGMNAINHVKDKVTMNTFFDDDGRTVMHLLEYSRYSSDKVRPVEGFYLHPKTRCLQYVEGTNYRKLWAERKRNEEIEEWPSTKNLAKFTKIEGIWYEIGGSYGAWEVVRGEVRPVEYRFAPSKKPFPSALKNGDKRQLSREESERLERWIQDWKDGEYGK